MSNPSFDLFANFGVGRRPGSQFAELVQQLGPGVTDHRGLIDLPALTMLFDDIGGLPFFVAEPGPSMQSRLSMSLLGRPAVDDCLIGTADLALIDGEYGATSVEIRSADRAFCVGTARNVRVGREVVDGGDHMEIPAPVVPEGVAAAIGEEAQGLDGRELVRRIADGRLSIGEIGELLGCSVVFDDDQVTLNVATAPWMGNIMGTMHGGVIGAVVAQAVSFAAQAVAPAGVDYLITDFTIDFLRSPVVDGRTVVVRTEAVKVGRRLAVFSAQLFDGETLLAHATADAKFG